MSKPRIGTADYINSNPQRACVYNSNYDEAGHRDSEDPRPWVVEINGRIFGAYETQPAAMTRAVRMSE